MESYSIKNIKSFEEKTDVEIKPITIFVGKNSCGKSSLLRFPVVLSQTFNADTSSPLKFYGKLIDYGNYEDVVFKNKKEPIEFSLKFKMDIASDRVDLASSKENSGRVERIRDVEVFVKLNKDRKKVIVVKNELYIDGQLCYGLYREKANEYKTKVFRTYDIEKDEFSENEYEICLKSPGNQQFFVEIGDIADGVAKTYFKEGFPELEETVEGKTGRGFSYKDLLTMPLSIRRLLIGKEDIDIPNSERIAEYTFVVSAFSYYAELLGSFYRICDIELCHLSYIGPFRMNPERVYRDEEFQTRRVGVKGENVSTVLIRDYQKKKELVSKISSWLKRTMGYNLVVDEISNGLFSILLEDSNGIRSNLIDVGYGVSQILPIVAQILVDAPKRRYQGILDNIIIVEQPELHLHPAAQSELADLIVDGAIEGKKKMMIETHSEHLIRKLQVLVSDPDCKLTNDDIVVYYVDKDENGCAHIKELKMLPNGKFADRWPSGFFDKAHELSMELLKNSIS